MRFLKSGLVVVSLLAACAPPIPAPPPGPGVPPGPPPERPADLPPVPAAGLPQVPRVDGPLQIRVVHPTPETPRPNVASTFVYGSVGTGAARLTINGEPVEVHPNGAFLAFLPTPADGQWRLQATANGQTEQATVAYRAPAAPTAAARAPTTVTFAQPRLGTVTGGADTLATGSDVAIGRPTPTGAYRWFFPRGAALTVTGERGDQVQVRLGAETGWVNANQVTFAQSAPARQPIDGASVREAADWVDVVIPGRSPAFRVEPAERGLTLTLYDATLRPNASAPAGEPIASARWSAPDTLSARLTLQLTSPLWGYKVFYGPGGELVLRLRRPPRIDAQNPFQGLRIVIDPGHPPGGATGPTGLTEAEANLQISLPLADMLRRRGAEVILTRTEHVTVSLAERLEIANRADAHLLVSVHNNAFAEGANPFRRHGTSTYYFHAHAAPLARALQREIQATTQIPDLGALTGNLALVRPTWMPAVLTESLFMAIPEQEAALRHPGFSRNVAEAHVRGLESFLRQF